MTKPFSNAAPYLAQLKGVEQQITRNELQPAALQLNLLAKSNSHDPRLFLLGARLAEAAHNPDGVLLAARKAHELAPTWATATIHLAEVLADRGVVEESMLLAEQAIQQAATASTEEADLLTKAVAIAHRLKQYPHALSWLRQIEQVRPYDFSVRYKIAYSLLLAGQAADAIDIFSELLLQKPSHPVLLKGRMHACLDAQQLAQAIQDGEALVAIEPDNEEHRFYLDIARGITPKTQPTSVVSGLFDGYATHFDRHLVQQLQYKLPRQVAAMIQQWHPDRKGDVLDLGCGTGLMGAYLGPIEGVLVGVDLSGAMLEQAGRHQVYDSLHKVDIVEALQATPGELYDVITALDVLIYVGKLDSVIPNVERILRPGGRFVFSCEAGSQGGADYALQATYRYTHQPSYVKRLLAQAGFADIDLQDCVLRYESGKPVQGFLVTARKALKAARKSTRRSDQGAKAERL